MEHPVGCIRPSTIMQQKGFGIVAVCLPERVVTIHKSPAQLYFLFGIFIIPRRCKYANEAGGPLRPRG